MKCNSTSRPDLERRLVDLRSVNRLINDKLSEQSLFVYVTVPFFAHVMIVSVSFLGSSLMEVTSKEGAVKREPYQHLTDAQPATLSTGST